MSSRPDFIDAWLDGESTPEQEERLQEWLEADPANLRTFVRETHTHRLVREIVLGDNARAELDESTGDQPSELSSAAGIRAAARKRRTSSRRRKRTSKTRAWLRYGVAPLAAAAAVLLAAHFYNVHTIATAQEELCATVIEVRGAARLVNRDGTAVKRGGTVRPGGKVATGADGYVKLRYPDSSTLEIKKNSAASLLEHEKAKRIKLDKGELTADVTKQKPDAPMILGTAHARAKVIGTSFTLQAAAAKTRLEVTRGEVRLTRRSDDKFVDVSGGYYAEAGAGVELMVTRMPSPVAPTEKAAFTDNFNGSPLDQWPRGWGKHATQASSRSGYAVLQEPGGPGKRFLGCPRPPSGVTQHAFVPFSDWGERFKVSFRMRLSGKGNTRAGIELEGEGPEVSFEYDASTAALKTKEIRRAGEGWRLVRKVPLELEPGTWSLWEVSAEGKHFSLRVNGKLLLEAEAPREGLAKRVSLISSGKDSAHFDEVRVVTFGVGPKR